MKLGLSSHFTYFGLLRFTIAPILMMIFTSLYSIVDGLFIANFASNNAFAGVNLVFPLIMIIGAIGFMFGSGGSALVGKLLGEGKNQKARQTFSLIIVAVAIIGLLFSLFGYFMIAPFTRFMASVTTNISEDTIDNAITYGKILISFTFLFMIQNVFQSFFIVNEKQGLGFAFTIGAGITNMILDALFIGLFRWGVVGAAAATVIGYAVGSVGPLIYFFINKKGLLYFEKFSIELKSVGRAAYNGSSEFISNVAGNIISIFYNYQLLKYVGEVGVSAYGVIMYLGFVFAAMFIGYCIGVAPIISYNYGSQNHDELKNILRRSLIIIGSVALTMFLIGELSAPLFARMFSNGDEAMIELTTTAMRIYSISFIFMGLSMFFSSFFTALNNGLISGLISFLRTLVFQIGFVLLFPLMFGINGIWWSIVGAEFLSLTISIIFIFIYRNKYHY